MKKTHVLALILAVSLVLTGCCISHDWQEADCLTAKTCTKCQETEGVPLGHSWSDASCLTPKTCALCSLTEGEPLGHDWQENGCENPITCTLCGMEDAVPGHSISVGRFKESDGAVVLRGDCDTCGQTDVKKTYSGFEEAISQAILGKWHATDDPDSQYYLAENVGSYLEFLEDGMVNVQYQDQNYTASWQYNGHMYMDMGFAAPIGSSTVLVTLPDGSTMLVGIHDDFYGCYVTIVTGSGVVNYYP